MGRKFCCYSLSPSSPIPIYVLLFSFIIRDRTIRQRRSLWKRCWKIDFASFKTILRLSQIPLLIEGRQFLELKRGDRTWVQTEMVWFIAWPFSVLKYRVVQGRQSNWQKSMMHLRVAGLLIKLNPLLFWRSRCRRRCNFVMSYCNFCGECIKLN